MTGQPPPSRDRDLGFDEFIAILVSLAAIGSILFWGLTRRDAGFRFADLQLFPSPATAERRPFLLSESPEPTRLPAPSPQVRATPSPGVRTIDPSPRAVQPGTALAPTTTGTVVPAPIPVVVAPPPTGEATEFSDVPSDFWAYPFITELSRRGIITGFDDGTFQPDTPISRAQYAALLENILPPDQRAEAIDFPDVPEDFWARTAIDDAVQAGFLSGYPEGNFAPDDQISKQQALVSLANGTQLPEVSNPEESVTIYEDSDQISDWAVPVIASATESGVVVNHPEPSVLAPAEPVTRAEIAALIYQALESANQVEPIQSEFIVRP
jgi:hypothetical protein